MIAACHANMRPDLVIQMGAPSATRTRDLLLRRTLPSLLQRANAQVRSRLYASRVTVIEREWWSRVARLWHGGLFVPKPNYRVCGLYLSHSACDGSLATACR
jgi:hypothetical protein